VDFVDKFVNASNFTQAFEFWPEKEEIVIEKVIGDLALSLGNSC
jgi:hypothetical protein